MSLSAVLKYNIHMYQSVPDVLQKLLQACTKVESALLIESSINRVASEQRLSLLKLFIIVQSVDLTVRPWMEVNHFPSACIWRTALTSPADKSFMTLQCCGPHSTRPASTDQRLHSNSQHAHRRVRCFRSCAKKKWLRQTPITNVRPGRHTDSQALRSVSIYLSPPGPGSVSMYPLRLHWSIKYV